MALEPVEHVKPALQDWADIWGPSNSLQQHHNNASSSMSASNAPQADRKQEAYAGNQHLQIPCC